MKIFISSVIRGMEPFRDAAAHAAKTLKHSLLRAEDFGASPDSPQRVCLAGVRAADAVLLLMGARYGDRQTPSNLSATHEEYREARDRCDVLVFVQGGVRREADQEMFVGEVRAWTSGHYTATFSTPDELRDAVLSALHDLELSRKTGPVEEPEMLTRARTLVPSGRDVRTASVCVVVVGGPRQQVLRPSELEDHALAREVLKEALFGSAAVLTTESGSEQKIDQHSLMITQDDRSVQLDQLGSIRIIQPSQEEESDRRAYLPVLLEEEVRERIERGLRFAAWLLDKIDPTHRLTAVLPLAAVLGAGHLGWRTRAEHERKPHSVQMNPRSGEQVIAQLAPAHRHRAALAIEYGKLAQDLTVLLRRDLRQ